MEHIEDHMHGVWTEWAALKEKWFHGEKIDPVFEGVVRDFCVFDETMHNIYNKVGVFMKGVDQLCTGMVALSEGVSKGLSHTSDSQISSDSCKLKEATNQIARADAPHSAVAKLRRDMHFNILTPVQNHIANNRNLKVSLDIRRRRLIELNGARKQYEDCVKRNISQSDRRFITAQANFESAKMTFNDVDRHVFEWLYILEEYRGDILDSTLQTLKYLQYEFFATSAHAISSSLPSRMEFRPMVEMTPEHLEAQVEMELQEGEENGNTEEVTDFSVRLIEKKARDDPGEPAALPVDPLSLSSLLSQGFEEGPARRALRLHQNNTQAALDWLINGQSEVEEKRKAVSEGVRMPTTVKRVQKLKAMRKAQAEKQRRQAGEREDEQDRSKGGDSSSPSRGQAADPRTASRKEDDECDEEEETKPAPAASKPAPPTDLLSLDEEPPPPSVCGGQVSRSALPEQILFEDIRCEKPPIPAAVAAGIAQPRETLSNDLSSVLSPAPAGQGLAPDLMAQVQALAAQSSVTPEQLILAAQQLQAKQPQASPLSGGPGAPTQPQASPLFGGPGASGQVSNGDLQGLSLDGLSMPSAPSPQAAALGGAPGAAMTSATPAQPGTGGTLTAGGFAALDPLALASSAPAAGYPAAAKEAPKPVPEDKFGDLVNLTGTST